MHGTAAQQSITQQKQAPLTEQDEECGMTEINILYKQQSAQNKHGIFVMALIT